MSQFIEMFGGVKEKKSLCVISRPRQWPTIQTKDFTTNGYFVYGANGIIGKYSSYNHEDETLTIACRGASCGAINLTSRQSYITGNAMSIDELSNEVELKYLQHFLLYYDFSSIITGGAQPQITYANLRKVEVPIPPISLQNEFVAIAQQADKSKFVGFKSQFIEMSKAWPVMKLNGHVDIIRGVSYKPSDVVSSLDANSVGILRANNIANGEINTNEMVYVDQSRVSDAQRIRIGDIIVCASSGSQSLVGKAAINKNLTREYAHGAFCLLIRCNNPILPKYLNIYLQTALYRNQIESLSCGSNILNIKAGHLTSLDIPIPDIKQQSDFVTIIEQADKSKYFS